jgi:AcrR family transcriptional regulator
MPRANLNKEKIFEAAARLANERGFAALSLKDIAAHFGVKPPSLFKHVRDLAEIKDALAISGMTKLRDAVVKITAQTLPKRLSLILHAYRDFARKFPGEYDAFQETHVVRSPAVYKLGEEVLAVFSGALPERYTPAEKIHALRFIRSSLHGFVTLEKNDGFGLDADVRESFVRMTKQLVTLLGT